MRPTTVRRQLLVAAISTAILAVVLWLGARTIDEREPGWLATAYQWLFSASSATATTGIDVPAQVEKSLERLAVPAVDAAAPERDAPSRPARTGEDVRKASMAPGASARKAGEGLTRLTDDDTRSSSVARAVSAQQVGDDLRRLTVPDADLPENCQRPTGAFQPSNPAIVTDPTDLGFLHASIFGPLPGEPDELSPLPTSKRGKELAGAMAVRGADVEVGYAAWYREAGGSPEIGVFAIRLKTPSATEPRTDLAQRRGMPNAPTGTLTKGSVVILYWSDAHATTPDLGCIDVVRRHLESIDLN
jgi:hypothetical protein